MITTRLGGVGLAVIVVGCGVWGCSDSSDRNNEDGAAPNEHSTEGGEPGIAPASGVHPAPAAIEISGEPVGNPEGKCGVHVDARLEDVSAPDHVVGTGTPESCTGQAVVDAVAQGGVITFDCGDEPTTIVLTEPAKIFNDASDRVVIDGGGLVTLSGGGTTRILYMNTCDENQRWTTDHCDNQEFPQLSIQNLGFVDANSKVETEYDGGGAVWVRGGRVKVINSRFERNVCADEGPDVGGGALRVLSQYQNLPVHVVGSTFGGEVGAGNECANGGGLSSIGVSWSIANSVFTHNRAVGNGGNPAQANTPGGGSGGAIYNDGANFTLDLCGVRIENNQGKQYGGAIFFVSNPNQSGMREGHMFIRDSVLKNNTSEDAAADQYPGIFVLQQGEPEITSTTIE